MFSRTESGVSGTKEIYPGGRLGAKLNTKISVATRQDLARFAKCVSKGESAAKCLAVGDNGVGYWGDDTWKTKGPAICALPAAVAVHNKKVRVTLSIGHGKPFVCICRDRAPAGIIDLNPAALIAAGLSRDDDIDDPNAHWEWAE